MNYDPNIIRQCATQTVKLVFGQWDYRAEFITTVGGNCAGYNILDSAISSIFEELPEKDGGSIITLKRPSKKGRGFDTLEVGDEGDGFDDFLKDMLISAEIIKLEPEKE